MRIRLQRIVFLILICSSVAQAQLIVNNTTMTPAQLVQNAFVGPGITPTNIKFNGSAANANVVRDQVAEYSTGATPTNLGLNQGLLLTTGKATVALGPNNSTSSSLATGTPTAGDADLALLSGQTITNVAVLEFDFVAIGSGLKFDFVFGSEEYPEFVGSFNDVFGFFLSGAGISGSYSGNAKNIAVIPSTNTGIAINTVNNGLNNNGTCANCFYYYNNSTIGMNPNISGGATVQYDGFTVPFTISSSLVVGQTYHLKLAVGNTIDNLYDSAVFLKNFSIPAAMATTDFAVSKFEIYPNPSNGEVSIENMSNIRIDEILVCDINGRTVKYLKVNSTRESLNISELKSGVYFLNIISDEGTVVKKLIKK